MFTLTRPKLGAFNPSDLLSGGIEYLAWFAKSDAEKTAEFQDAAKFEKDVAVASALWEQGMNAMEAPYPEGFDYFVDAGFWTQYQAAVEDLDEWVQRAKPILERLHDGLEELVGKAVADGKLPPDTWARINASARGLRAYFIPLLIGAAILFILAIIGYFGPNWVRAFADADVIRQEGAARIQAYKAVEAMRLEGFRQFNAARAQQGLAPVNVPFQDLPQNNNGRGGSGSGLGTGIAIGGGVALAAIVGAFLLFGGKKGND